MRDLSFLLKLSCNSLLLHVSLSLQGRVIKEPEEKRKKEGRKEGKEVYLTFLAYFQRIQLGTHKTKFV